MPQRVSVKSLKNRWKVVNFQTRCGECKNDKNEHFPDIRPCSDLTETPNYPTNSSDSSSADVNFHVVGIVERIVVAEIREMIEEEQHA